MVEGGGSGGSGSGNGVNGVNGGPAGPGSLEGGNSQRSDVTMTTEFASSATNNHCSLKNNQVNR